MATKTRSSLWLLGAISGALLLGVVSSQATRPISDPPERGAAAAAEHVEASPSEAEASPAELEGTLAQLRQRAEAVASQRARRAVAKRTKAS